MVPTRMAEDRGAGTIISVASAETDAARIRYKYILSMLNSSVNIDYNVALLLINAPLFF